VDSEEPHGWPEPIDQRSRYRLCQVAFFLAAAGAALSCLSFGCRGLAILMNDRRLFGVTNLPWWEFLVRAPSLMTTLFAGFILIGRWPDRRWRTRATVIAILTTFNMGIWLIAQAEMLGLPMPPGELAQDRLTQFISGFFASVVVLLLAGSADDVCRHLHCEGSAPLTRAAQSAAGLAAALMAIVMANVLDWGHGWPFRAAMRMDRNTFLMYLAWLLTRAVAAAFLAILCGRACVCCGEEASRLDRIRREEDPFRVWTK
jgi:hypothetical protein